jgi:hypothetical protein
MAGDDEMRRPYVEAWSQVLTAEAWRRLDAHKESKGRLVVKVVKRRAGFRTHRRQQGAEAMMVIRYR